jgi:hypothetical protein
MKIDDIEAFVTVVRCQSISHAAQALELTQPVSVRRSITSSALAWKTSRATNTTCSSTARNVC